ncbi:2-methoxy-6-polyprenyl-1,4-benzoquinol methylase, mitochondrial-like [Acanthaster planci]|uniref:2-methoxy-6-polyprenyl-1,4-benzoquinol methylase, mitochondrial n=1 Tax=Acanthaster planci TaxID=133434 RepID=A0A8B7ZY30_ACAPL|nr:2-methoxy-6-polyprenyl-1,4-benzoquinol methylase, mitochondrial-like [Acanthaster planci]
MAARWVFCRSCFRLLCRPTFAGRRSHASSYASSASDASSDSDDFEQKETHFGFETVKETEKPGKVYEIFKNVAEKYDVMNDAMSLGIHRLWKDQFMQVLKPTQGTRLLDVAGGTGDIAFRFLDFVRNAQLSSLSLGRQSDSSSSSDSGSDSEYTSDKGRSGWRDGTRVTVCDISLPMLKVGQQRAEERGLTEGISWVVGDAEELPIASESVDACTIAFGIRNVTHVQEALNEAHRVLVPGGRFLCLEFSHINNPLLRSLYDNYSFQVIPVLGQVIASDWKSYQYLVESIRQFPNQEEFAEMIQDAGFSMVTYENLSFGIAAIHSGFKL